MPPNHAGVWGLARTARTEEPSLKLRCIDVGGFIGGTEDFANAVAQWVLSLESSSEMEVAVRPASENGHGAAFVPRLQRSTALASTPKPVDLFADATYVFTGGTGGLGLVMARAFVERGAKHLLLLSRGGRVPEDSAAQREWLEAGQRA